MNYKAFFKSLKHNLRAIKFQEYSIMFICQKLRSNKIFQTKPFFAGAYTYIMANI